MRLPMPELVVSSRPITLPRLPNLSLPGTPSAAFHLPGIPTLPGLPDLPSLPSLPGIPTVNLPELPPPPTIPKLFANIDATLNILKVMKKVMCMMRFNPFVPEWRAGDQIAQITERQGKLGIDFLNVEFPQYSMRALDAVKVATSVDLTFQADFILEMMKATVAPFNRFSSDLSGLSQLTEVSLPSTIKPIENPKPIDVRLESFHGESHLEKLSRAFA